MRDLLHRILKYRAVIGLLIMLMVVDVFLVRTHEVIYTGQDYVDREIRYYLPGEYDFAVYGDNNKQCQIVISSASTGYEYINENYEMGDKVRLSLTDIESELEFGLFSDNHEITEVRKAVVHKCFTSKEKYTVILFNIFMIILMAVVAVYVKREKKIPCLEVVYSIGLLAVISILQLMILDAIASHSYDRDYMWMTYKWLDNTTCLELLMWNAIIVFGIHLVVMGLLKRSYISTIISTVILWVIAEVMLNYYLIRGEGFSISQLQLAGEAGQVIHGFSISFPWHMIIWLAIITLSAIICMPVLSTGYRWYGRLISVLLGVVILGGLYFKAEDILKPIGKNDVYILDWYYQDVGYYLGIVRTAPRAVEAPEGYTKERLEEIASENQGHSDKQVSNPDIIYVQCESLYDLSLITEPDWNEDPLEGLYAMDDKPEAQVTYLLSPMTGGGTCNVEYEALTGYSYWNTDGTPYIDKLSEGMSSLVTILENRGYVTTAIHTNTGGFFNRRAAYTFLGFDKSIFEEEYEQEHLLTEEDKVGIWYNDWATYKLLIDEYENRDTSKPFFAHVVTTQNHGPYTAEYYDGIDVNGAGDSEAKAKLQNYLNLSKLSVESLKQLLAYFENVDNDVVIVFWGDHCPGYNMFDITVDDPLSEVKSHYTPLMIWNNYGMNTQWPNVVSSYQVPEYLCHDLGIDTDVYMNYLYNNQVPATIGNVVVEDVNEYTDTSTWDDRQIKIWDNMWMLQYDRMFGKKYSQQ